MLLKESDMWERGEVYAQAIDAASRHRRRSYMQKLRPIV